MPTPLADRVAAFHAGRISLEQLLLELMRRRWAVPTDGSRPVVEKDPSGSSFIPAFSEAEMLPAPEGRAWMSGPALLDIARVAQAGIAFDLNQPHATNLLAAQLDVLRAPAAVARLEETIRSPRAGEGRTFREATWLTLAFDDRVAPVEEGGLRLIPLCTTPAAVLALAARHRGSTACRISGANLAGIDRRAVDGVWLGAGLPGAWIAPPALLDAAAAGQDHRPGAVGVVVPSLEDARFLGEQHGTVRAVSAERLQVDRGGHPLTIPLTIDPRAPSALCSGHMEEKARTWLLAASLPGAALDGLARRRLEQAAGFCRTLVSRLGDADRLTAATIHTAAGMRSLRMQPVRFERASLLALQAGIHAALG